jgi:hypothetical protein
MKKLFLFLLLANAALFAYGYYRHVSATSSADAERFRPLNPESVKVLSAQQVAKLGPAKVAQLTLACAEWGPLNEPELTRARQLLEPLGLGRTLATRRVDVNAEHWVYIPPKANKGAAERALAELGRLNVTDAAIVSETGPWQWSISLGVFRTRSAADNRFEEVRQKGVKTATYRSREQAVAMTAIVLREPQQATLQKLEEFKTQIPGSTVTTGACPENR